jgi:hypothetical protein
MTDLEVKALQLENNGMKVEILNLRSQLAQALMPAVQQEREQLIAEYRDLEAKAKKADGDKVTPLSVYKAKE